MSEFRKMKKRAGKTVRGHLALFIFLALLTAFVGTEVSVVREAVGQRSGTEAAFSAPGGVADDKSVSEFAEGLLRRHGAEWYQAAVQKEREWNRALSLIGGSGIRGFLSACLNAFFAGDVFTHLAEAAYGVFSAQSLFIRMLIPAAFLLYAALWIFVFNMMEPASDRMMLEARVYRKVPLNRMLHIRNVRRWRRAAATMFRVRLYRLLWNLTVVGGPVKHYAYLPVPYIVAENPDLTPGEAICLSRKMMDGHKWEAFLYDLSFIGWRLLGIASFGVAEYLWCRPYYRAAMAEYYVYVREKARERLPEAAAQLNDAALYARMDAETAAAYSEVRETAQEASAKEAELKGVQKLFLEWFGVWVGRAREKSDYQELLENRVRMGGTKDALERRVYPVRLNPLYVSAKEGPVNEALVHCYTVWSVLLMFFLFSFAGWLWEITLHLIQEHQLVNRGLLHGPWLPIYGIGAVLIMVLLARFKEAPGEEFTLAIVVAGLVEYGIARYLELGVHHARYWDYHGLLLNLDGRICAESLLTFGVMGMLVVYVISPSLDGQIERLPQKLLILLCLMLCALLLADYTYSYSHPNGGEGVAVDITEGAWPTTLWRPDHLKINGVEVYNQQEAIAAEHRE